MCKTPFQIEIGKEINERMAKNPTQARQKLI